MDNLYVYEGDYTLVFERKTGKLSFAQKVGSSGQAWVCDGTWDNAKQEVAGVNGEIPKEALDALTARLITAIQEAPELPPPAPDPPPPSEIPPEVPPATWMETKIVDHENRITKLEAKLIAVAFAGSAIGGTVGEVFNLLFN